MIEEITQRFSYDHTNFSNSIAKNKKLSDEIDRQAAEFLAKGNDINVIQFGKISVDMVMVPVCGGEATRNDYVTMQKKKAERKRRFESRN